MVNGYCDHRVCSMTRSFDSNDLLKDLPAHGGDVLLASEKYGIPVDQWIDLSTGINPDPYPIHSIPAELGVT